MQISLTKHHGLENDFLVYDRAQGEPTVAWPTLAQHLCARSTGVGADGLLLLDIVDGTTLSMRLYNADGSVAEMSGNGIRCLVHAAHAPVPQARVIPAPRSWTRMVMALVPGPGSTISRFTCGTS